MTHTPGQWKVGEDEPFVYALNDAGTNRFFAGVQAGWLTEGGTNKPDDKRTTHEEVMANARLIAAAPTLLHELEHLVRLMEPYEDRLPFPGLATLNGARAAIKKARCG